MRVMAQEPERETAAAPRAPQVEPQGPVFVAYAMRGEGRQWADDAAATLRAWGVPVWHDACDLPPGNVAARIREALHGGLSGVVLIATPDVAQADFLRDVELPELHRLAREHDFGAVIVVVGPAAELERRGGGQALADALEQWFHQPVATRAELAQVAKRFAAQRVALFARAGARELPIRFCTREQARTARGPGLFVSYGTSRPGCRRPPADMWPRFKPFLASLKDLVAGAGVPSVRVRGQAQFSPAFALGAALPERSPVTLRVENRHGELWEGTADIEPRARSERWGEPGGAVAVFVDMLRQASHPTFEEHVSAHRDRFAASLKLVTPERRELTPAEGATLARHVAARVRAFAAGAPIHLFLAVPFEMAVLLGTLSNTLDVTLYEWEQEPSSHYVPTIRCRAGVGDGPLYAIVDRDA